MRSVTIATPSGLALTALHWAYSRFARTVATNEIRRNGKQADQGAEDPVSKLLGPLYTAYKNLSAELTDQLYVSCSDSLKRPSKKAQSQLFVWGNENEDKTFYSL